MADTIANDASVQDYADPVARLLTAGNANIFEPVEWPNYLETYDLGNEHVPALISMARDLALHHDDTDGPAVWAPVHAWRALAQMRAVEAIEPLLEFTRIELEDCAVDQEFAEVFGMIGPAAMAPIAAFLSDRTVPSSGASVAAGGLTEIAKRHPECRDECVGILTRLLEHAADMDPTAAGYAIGNLLDLKAVEAIDTIRQAFRLDAVDISIAGDLEDVEIDLGLRERRITPRPYYPLLPGQLASMEPSPGASVANSRQDFEEQPRPVKIGRNEPCPCGSGRKYKKCCLA